MEYSLHAPCRGRDEAGVRDKFRAAFPDLSFAGTADLIAEGDYVVGQWVGGGTQTGLITEEVGLDDGVTVLQQLGPITEGVSSQIATRRR